MKPITRKEYYLAKAAGTYTGPTPPPVLREDYYLATLAGDYSGYCPAPVTRLEKYMSAAAGLHLMYHSQSHGLKCTGMQLPRVRAMCRNR